MKLNKKKDNKNWTRSTRKKTNYTERSKIKKL
jgi:hypothetical protein